MSFVWSPIVTSGAGATMVDDTDYVLVRLPGAQTFTIKVQPRFLFGALEELAIEPPPILDDPGRYISDPNPALQFLVRQPHGWFEELIAIAQPTAPTTPTISAVASGSMNYRWVASIEGYRYLLTNGSTTAATDAWSGTGFTSALGGLFVRPSISSRLDPWDPFAAKGGSLTLQVAQSTTGDTFGTDLAIDTEGADSIDTFIEPSSIDCDDSTISVHQTNAFASSGVAYIGTEAVRYASKGATSFQSVERGIYAPFRTAASGTQGFAHPHEIVNDAGIQTITHKPVVSEMPRSWIGKWAGLWQHVYNPDSGLLNRKDDARCVFAGRIKSFRDNPTTMTTDVEVEHVLEWLGRAVVGENPWTCRVVDGVRLVEGQTFTFTEIPDGLTINTSTPLEIIAEGSTPASPYELAAGRYTITSIAHGISNWLNQSQDDGEIDGEYRMSLAAGPDGLMHGKFRYQIVGSGAVRIIALSLPDAINKALGGFASASQAFPGADAIIKHIENDGSAHTELSVGEALRSFGETFEIEAEFGDFYDQAASIPAGLQGLFNQSLISSGESGFCLLRGISDQAIACAVIKGTGEMIQCKLFDPATGQPLNPQSVAIPWSAGDVTLTQYIHMVEPFWRLLCRLFYSTGTTGYNHPDHDVYPASVGLAVPGEILQTFEAAARALPNADVEVPLLLTRPTKLADLIGGDMALRFAFFRWADEGLSPCAWVTPTAEAAVAELEESNKASPAGTKDEPRSITETSEEWSRNVVVVHSDRDFSLEESDSYHTHTTIVDRVAIDDAGRTKRTETINALNSYYQAFAGGSGSVAALIPHFKSIVPYFTRPVKLIKRTIAPTLFETLAVGDVVTVTDGFARDPDTGARGISSRPGIIVSHGYEPGGAQPAVDGTTTDPMHGEVEVMLFGRIRVGPMVPAAQVDDRASNGGYNSGTGVLTVYADKFARLSTSNDASWFSDDVYSVTVTEIDPSDPAAPLTWDAVLLSVSGNTLALDTSGGDPLSGWDSSKKYRVTFDTYNDNVGHTAERFTYQADSVSQLVEGARGPFQYTTGSTLAPADPSVINIGPGSKLPPPPLLPNTENGDVELPPNNSYGDGVGFDVGTHSACNRLINNLYDYKTATSSPHLRRTAMEVNGDVHHNYELVMVMPIFLGADQLTTNVRRKLYIAPFFYSSTGNSVNVRISLAGALPTGDTYVSVTRQTPYQETTFSTTSTSYTTPTPVGLDIGSVKDLYGVAYVLVEMQVPTASGSTIVYCRGLGACYQGPRE